MPLDVYRQPGTKPSEKSHGWFVDFYNQWTGIFGRNNWYDFTLVLLTFEWSPYKGSAELEVGLLGFRVIVTYVYDRSFNESMREAVAEIDSKTSENGSAER